MLCVGRGEGTPPYIILCYFVVRGGGAASTPPCWIIFRILLVQIVEALGGDDGLDLGAQGGEGLGQVVVVQAQLLADVGVDGGGAVVEGQHGGGGGLVAVQENAGDHVGGFHAQVGIVHAVAQERTVQGEGVSAGVVGDAGLGQSLVNGQLCGHHGVVGGGEHGVGLVGHDAADGQADLVGGGAVILLVGHALLIQVRLGVLDGCGGGVLTLVIQQGDVLGVGGGGEDQVQDGVGVQIVGGAGDVGAGSLQALHQAGADGVGHGGKDHGDVGALGGGLHGHGHGGGYADHQVHLVGDEVGNDLVQHGGIGVAVIIADLKGDALLLADGSQLGFDVVHDLIQGCVIHIVADANLVGCGAGGAGGIVVVFFAAGEEGQGQQGGQGQGQHTLQNVLFHFCFLQILYRFFGWRMEGPLPAAWILKTKKTSAPHGTKAFASAIPPKLTSCDAHSLLRTIMRTPRITGGFPSDPT